MAQKTIAELEEIESASESTDLVVDTGVQTFKMKLANVLKSAQVALVLTSTERDALADPEEGWEIYNSTQKCKQIYTGVGGWINVGIQTGDHSWSSADAVRPGFLECDGSSYLRTAYPDLFSIIGTVHGAADGTHFNVPNLQRRSPVGRGGTVDFDSELLLNTLGATGGEQTHRLTGPESGIAAHNHAISDPGHGHVLTQASNAPAGNAANAPAASNNTNLGTNSGAVNSSTTGITVSNAASTSANEWHNNYQPALILACYIKY